MGQYLKLHKITSPTDSSNLRSNCCLLLRHFVCNFGFAGLMTLLLYVSGDVTLRHSLVEDDIYSDTRNLLLHTEDQICDAHFEHLEPTLSEEDYIFSLEQDEGITDLFDINACDIQLWPQDASPTSESAASVLSLVTDPTL